MFLVFFVFSGPPRCSNQDLLAARAIPNTRLVRAFNLTNTFVSDSAETHTIFVGKAISLIKAALEDGWPHLQKVAMDAVDAALHDAGEPEVEFDSFIQDATMRFALVGLLRVGSNAHEFNSRDIRVVAKHITRLWYLSKRSDPIPDHLLTELNAHLRQLIPDEETYPNPLDYLIPVWETTWRVVATTVAYAHRHEYGAIFADLHSLPTINQFRARDHAEPSVEDVVTECMRLHPPSKRIMRSYPMRSFPGSSFVPLFFLKFFMHSFNPILRRECADIGAVLTSKDIWGAQMDIFDPRRWHPERVTEDQTSIKALAFGHGRYKCVASNWAPMAVGILCAALLDRLGRDGDYELVSGQRIGTRDGWDDWKISSKSGRGLDHK
ncbi:hypothetical protein H0H81_010492 [Sphagnurus paluster]|uniref:Cytochrome P450 n=1 Tax=Sphagnurus paluster TaxID=117069 RepID=A0A9P7GQ31_9AGAR|nr:hypothetical protein H0H81_010492 [Sphagnurus paluster]